jgi:hypothetical protein
MPSLSRTNKSPSSELIKFLTDMFDTPIAISSPLRHNYHRKRYRNILSLEIHYCGLRLSPVNVLGCVKKLLQWFISLSFKKIWSNT